MLKKHKIIISIIFLGFFLWLIWPRKNEETSTTPIPPKAIPTIEMDNNQAIFPETLKKIGEVNWNSEIKQDYPEKLNKITIKRKIIDEKRENEIKKYLGINDQNGYVLKDVNYIQYSNMPKNLESMPINNNWEIGQLKNKLRKIASDLNNEMDLKIEWTNTSYRKYSQPYLIETTQNEAQFLEIDGDYMVNETRLTTFHGESIRAFFDGQGNLLKISIYLKPEILNTNDYWEIMTPEEAKNASINNYRAGINDLYDEIKKVNLTQVHLVQVYDNLEESVGPYFLFDGNTYSQREQKPVNLPVLLRAEK